MTLKARKNLGKDRIRDVSLTRHIRPDKWTCSYKRTLTSFHCLFHMVNLSMLSLFFFIILHNEP